MNRRTVLAALVAFSCGSPPKPREVSDLEDLRKSRDAEPALKKAPILVNAADMHLDKAQKAWKDDELDESRRAAIIGIIKLRTAIELVKQDRARSRAKTAEAQAKKLSTEAEQLTRELDSEKKQIALLEKLKAANTNAESELAKAAAEREKLNAQLSEQQRRADASSRIAAAELALKSADTVEALTYAKTEYKAAQDLIARAHTELKGGKLDAAATSADMAKTKAEAALAAARPAYEEAAATTAKKARTEALAKDAAGLPGIQVRVERKGEVTRLVLPLYDLFKRKMTTVDPKKESLVDGVYDLLKKYPDYPVQVVGHTDSKGKKEQLVALSLARAQAVLNLLVSRGADPKRFLVSGQGPDDPVADNKSVSGRAKNNRVEVVFLYQ